MELISKKDLEQNSGSRCIPDVDLTPDVLREASASYAKMVTDNPEYEFSMVYDQVSWNLTIYWKRIA